MAVTYVTDNEVVGDVVSSITTPPITVSGTNRVAVATVCYESTVLSSVSGGGATWAAVSGASGSSGTRWATIWHGIAPTTGAQTFTATFSNGDGAPLSMCVVIAEGADQTTPTADGTTASAGTSDSDPTVTVGNVTADDLVVDGVFHTNVGAAGTGQTARFSSPGYGAASTQAGADGGVMSWTRNEDLYWVTVACRVVAAVVGATNDALLVIRRATE